MHLSGTKTPRTPLRSVTTTAVAAAGSKTARRITAREAVITTTLAEGATEAEAAGITTVAEEE